MTNVILIGCGPHAKRVYMPAIQRLTNARISLILELKGQESSVDQVVKRYGAIEVYFTDWFQDNVPSTLEEVLDAHIQENNVMGVIIATEPLVHKAGCNSICRLDKAVYCRQKI